MKTNMSSDPRYFADIANGLLHLAADKIVADSKGAITASAHMTEVGLRAGGTSYELALDATKSDGTQFCFGVDIDPSKRPSSRVELLRDGVSQSLVLYNIAKGSEPFLQAITDTTLRLRGQLGL